MSRIHGLRLRATHLTSYLFLALSLNLSCGGDDTTRVPTTCRMDLVLTPGQASGEDGWERHAYETPYTRECATMLRQREGGVSYEVEVSGAKAIGGIAQISFDAERTDSFPATLREASFIDGAVYIRRIYARLDYSQPAREAWQLPWPGDFDGKVRVTVRVSPGSLAESLPRIVAVTINSLN